MTGLLVVGTRLAHSELYRDFRRSYNVLDALRLEPIPVGAAPSHCTRRRCSKSSCTVSTFRFLRSGATHTASARLPTEIGS
ncbi:hypothetical protein Cenrod_1904 [Candidatus Symbiobacter mobilis CR]|uniref:Uncharacterized protein n=1 Tax=Candidatus Symbiobacter mobilis CR TaxID=946483 RepID=U5N9A7_9BURK|nr:hypothetical protein Cenrod_1904 [Candidatus Symbiobacter mobilis CR]